MEVTNVAEQSEQEFAKRLEKAKGIFRAVASTMRYPIPTFLIRDAIETIDDLAHLETEWKGNPEPHVILVALKSELDMMIRKVINSAAEAEPARPRR